jgi:hypothetical protein
MELFPMELYDILVTFVYVCHINKTISGCAMHLICSNSSLKGCPGAAVKLLPCDHEVIGSSPGNLLQKCRKRPKVVGPLPGPCASSSYVHQAALLNSSLWRKNKKQKREDY